MIGAAPPTEQRCGQTLSIDPNRAHSLHMRGLSAQNQGILRFQPDLIDTLYCLRRRLGGAAEGFQLARRAIVAVVL